MITLITLLCIWFGYSIYKLIVVFKKDNWIFDPFETPDKMSPLIFLGAILGIAITIVVTIVTIVGIVVYGLSFIIKYLP